MITSTLEFGLGECAIGGFQLLQTDNVRLGLRQPLQQIRKAPIDVVDVEGGDTSRARPLSEVLVGPDKLDDQAAERRIDREKERTASGKASSPEHAKACVIDA